MVATANNLPIRLSSFIGRERESADVKRLLSNARLTTLTGPGGCGKTSLALHVASELAASFAQGVCWVDLAPLADPSLVPQAALKALELSEQPGQTLTETLLANLGDKQLLLILDNCEHLIGACAELVTRLLLGCRALRILTTSREALNVAGEVPWTVPSLQLPGSVGSTPATDLYESDAVRLFAERAATISPTFQLTAQNAPVVAQICRWLEGIPLAIELAAARVKVLSVEQIALRLDDALHLLTEGTRSAPRRQQTLQATLDWSYHLLSEPEQAVFYRLAIFAGSFTLSAAESICTAGTIQGTAVLDLISHLVEKSLLIKQEPGTEARYRLQEPTRQYAWRKLAESGESQTIGQQHLSFYLALAESSTGELFGPSQPLRDERLAQEHDNLRAALRWALDHGPLEYAVRLALALEPFWAVRGYLYEGERWLLEALGTGRLWLASEATPTAHAVYARLQVRASRLLWTKGDHATARPLAESGLAYIRASGDHVWTAFALQTLGLILSDEGDDAAAGPLLTEAVAINREAGNPRALASALLSMGSQRLREGADEEAQRYLEEASTLARASNGHATLASAEYFLGCVALNQRDPAVARAHFTESLALRRIVHDQVRVWACLDGVAGLALLTGQPRSAAKLCSAVERLQTELAARFRRHRSGLHERNLAAVRMQLDERTLNVLWAEGQAMSLEQAVAEAEQVLNAPVVRPDPNALTPRELDVLRLVVAGLSDAQIAAKLVVSPRTVNTHLTSIYSKLGVKSRSAAARHALEHRLL